MTLLYADERTRALVESSTPIVYLYGGFEGFENYGDVLQLKTAIRFHREVGRTPVMVATLAAWTAPGLLGELYGKYDVEGIIFEDDELLDAAPQGLGLVGAVRGGQLLHIYGGGYFNRYWGERRAAVTRALIDQLGIDDYVVSGLQVDEDGARHLAGVFASHPPLLAGGRDAGSHHLLERVVGDRAGFSFDDAVETIEALRDMIQSPPPVSLPVDVTVGLHANVTTEYMSSSQGAAVRDALAAVARRHPGHALTLLHAYNDSRSLVTDTLETASALGIAARYPSFAVVNLATVAGARVLDPTDARRVGSLLGTLAFAISASYHVALTLNLLGRPAFLLATNDYYRDKRLALGLPSDLDSFLADPGAHRRDYAEERERRAGWLERLRAVVEAVPGPRGALGVPAPKRPRRVRSVADKYFVP
jgi:hypothetical protein